ncbi:hypothetical protein JRO89_XS02G0138500 [Xanthoceras sorbifolium]|uniref:GAG-pre-integrase domain-containing protein n=1 Tax=Xanthoceras sorbifolium TaxID=99658 RepID=A0ABQ8IFT6_9ROSI|nr:hypothetical protein JRO89_XS02G0138500 [Xanthoceras sorbifolium]
MTVPSIPESSTAASSIPESSTATTSPQVILMGTNNNNQHQSLIAINSTQVPIKLTKGGNYAAWRSQFENLFPGYGLMGYLDGTKPCPPATIAASTSTEQPSANPDHQIWLSWNKLEATYANRSNIRKLGLLDSLTNVTLADKSVADYMQGIKNILNNLELIGHPVDDGAIVIHTLNGLRPAYLPLASAILARDTPITFEELYDKLLDHEAFIQRDKAKKAVVTTPTKAANTGPRNSNNTPLKISGVSPPTIIALGLYVNFVTKLAIQLGFVAHAHLQDPKHSLKQITCPPSNQTLAPTGFLTQDLTIGASLVRGRNKGNLYVWPLFNPVRQSASSAHLFSASLQSSVSFLAWHCRLGHLSLQVLQNLVSS